MAGGLLLLAGFNLKLIILYKLMKIETVSTTDENSIHHNSSTEHPAQLTKDYNFKQLNTHMCARIYFNEAKLRI